MELGGKAANIIFEDAPLDQAVEGVINGIYFNQGHVCCANNYMLSQERAIAIANYLVKNGVSSNRITYSAYSNSRPLVPEIDDESRQKNRRVEILVTGN